MKRSALSLRLLLTFFGGFALLLSTAAGLAGYSTSPAQPSSVALQDSSIPEEPPPLPASFYGAVALEGEPVLPGTSVSAWIDGVQFAASATFLDGNVPVYRLDVPADHLDTPEVEGGRPGDTIVFQVSGFTADQTAEWQSASNSRLDLSATPSPEPTAHFTIGKGLNTAQWEDGASVVNFSSVASTSSSVRPENAIDNSSSTIWRTATGQTTEQWVKVALIGDGLHVVDRVILRGSSSSVSLKDFDIRVSTTGAEDDDFTTIFSGSVPRDNDLHEFTFSPVHARYVQLFIRSNHGGSQLQVNHFQVWTREREGGIVSLHEGPPAAIAAFSSQLSASFSPENAIDEIPGSAWLSANGQTAEQWFIVELGGGLAYTIDRVRLQSGSVTEGARDFEIRVSTTGIEDADFTTVFSGTAAANTDLQEFVFSAPAPARYVQLFVRNNHGSTIRIRVNAFQVLTPDGANVSRLEGVGAFVLGFSSQSSASTRPENAIDFDDSNTAWRTASGQVTDQWLTIRLIEGAPYLIDRIRLKGASGTSSPKDFEIRVSNTTLDDTSFTTVLNGTLPSDGQFHWFTLPPVEARYVQLFISDNYGGSQIAVIDFRVFSPELGGATVPFDDFSTDFHGRVVAWQWDFGDGKAATEQHPIHTFATPGVYTVRLTVTDNEGFTGTTARAYHVLPGPVADFTWSPLTPDEGQNTNFVDTSTSLGGPIVGRLWQFSHTSVGSTSATPAIRFPDNGEFTATLSATDSQLLTATVSRTITVLNVPPTVNAGNDQVLVWGQDWQINTLAGDVGSVDRGSLRCLWDYGDGQTLEIQSCNSTSAGAPHAYADPGVYTATLTVSDKDGASSIDSLVATVHKRDAILLNYSVRSISNSEAEVKAGLFDTFDWDELMTGQTITFDATGQVVTATVDANGVATALLSVLPGQTITLTTSFAGDTFYNAASDIDVVTVAPTLPSADIVFIIDESGSMADDQNQVKARVNDIVDQLGHSTDFRLGLVGFATTFGADRPDHIGLIHTPLTADVDLFKAKLNGLVSVLGRAYGFNATTVAMSDQMDFRSGAGVCAILITDSGGQEANPTSEAPETREEAVAALQSRNAVFLGIVNVNDVNIRNNYGPNGGSLAAESGGDVFHILDFRANPGLVFAGMIDHCVQQIIERTPPDLSLEKSDGQAEVAGGATLTYTLTISNSSIQGATGVTLVDTLPAQTTFLAASDGGSESNGIVTWPAFTVAALDSVTRTVTVRANLVGETKSITNTATVSDDGSHGPDPAPENNTAEDVTTIAEETGVLDLAIRKDDGETAVLAGQMLTYTLTVSNTGTLDATGITLADTLPAHVAFLDASDGGSESRGIVTWPAFSLAAGDTATRTVTVQVASSLPAGIDVITNVVTVSDDGTNGPDATPENNSASDSNNVDATPDLTITKESNQDLALPGSPLSYTLTVGNSGSQDATGVVVTETVPAHTSFDAAASTPGWSCANGSPARTDCLFSVGDLPVGGSHTITFAVITADPLPDSATAVTNIVTVADDGSNGPDLDPADNAATVVIPTNHPPLAADDEVTTPEDTAVAIDVLTNDSDVDGDALNVLAVTSPADGVAQLNPDNTISYTPTLNYHGPDSFAYTIADTHGLTATATVAITVTPVNDPPVAEDDFAETMQETAVTIEVLANDFDVDGDALSVTAVSQPANGTANVNSDNTITFTPNLDFTGANTFTYTVSDGQGGSDTASVTVTVHPAPVCALYPIALHVDTLSRAVPGDLIDDIFNGTQPGNFGWLTWTGDNSVGALANSLTPPGDSHTYTNPNDPADHIVSRGDWVQGRPGVANAKAIRDALDALKSVDIVVPVWDTIEGSGSNARYHVVGFARIRLVDYHLPAENRISVRYLGPVVCGENDPDSWNYKCGADDTLQVEIIGAGMGSRYAVEHNPQTLAIHNPDTVDFILAQVVVKTNHDARPPDKVIVSTDREMHELLEPTITDDGYYYEVLLQPAGQVTAEVVGEGGSRYWTPRAFVTYLFRRSDGGQANVGRLIHAHVYHNSHSETFTIPTAAVARDVTVTFVVADVQDNSRTIVLRAEAGGAVREATVTKPNRGNELLIYSMTLASVPGDVDTITATVASPSRGGDSVHWGGVNVSVACNPAQVAP